MKKPLKTILLIFSGVVAGTLIASAVYMFIGFPVTNGEQTRSVFTEDAENADIIVLAYSVLGYIRDEDFNALSNVVHPEFGVVFSPYATINLATDRHLSAGQVAMLGTDTNIYVWGVYNGSGEPIKLTPAEYFERFIPAEEHLNADIIGVNRVIKSGHALENKAEVFPNVQFIDFHIPEDDSREDAGWRSVRLGFEEYNGELKLVTIVSSKWMM